MTAFEPLNKRVTEACTQLQLAEMGIGEPSNIGVPEWLEVLSDAGRAWEPLERQLVSALPRFGGYGTRFSTAVERAHGEPAWVTATDRDSAHRVWFELHEDLLATLGRSR